MRIESTARPIEISARRKHGRHLVLAATACAILAACGSSTAPVPAPSAVPDGQDAAAGTVVPAIPSPAGADADDTSSSTGGEQPDAAAPNTPVAPEGGADMAAAAQEPSDTAAGVPDVGAGTGTGTGTGTGVPNVGPVDQRFSFFVTSLEGMRRLSASPNGFGGDLRYGQTDGLSGADKICAMLAEHSMPGAAGKGWRAFLSAAVGPAGTPVDAVDRIGNGPWYDRKGRLVAASKADLMNPRPTGADPAIARDFPNELGIPNRTPQPGGPAVKNPNVLTGSNPLGRLHSATSTCDSWRSTTAAERPRVGFAWVMATRENWISGLDEGGCGAGVNLQETGPPTPSHPIVGSGGGYGAIYCFAMTP